MSFCVSVFLCVCLAGEEVNFHGEHYRCPYINAMKNEKERKEMCSKTDLIISDPQRLRSKKGKTFF